MADFAAQIFSRSLPREHGFEPLRVDGQLPAQLAGTLFRNGPGLFGIQGTPYAHPFEGDGVITGVRFQAGQAWGAARPVESAGLRDERRVGKVLYGGAAPWWRRMIAAHLGPEKVTANTSVLSWQGRLLALNEGGCPIEVDPMDLRTLGETRLGGVVRSAFSAHPHRVASRRATYNIGLDYGPKTGIHLYELPDEGAIREIGALELDYATMVHDFAMTDTHFVFFISPVRTEILRALLQVGHFGQLFSWRPKLGTEIVIVPIDAPQNVIRFETGPFFQWHFANAFHRAGHIVVDYVRFPDLSPFSALGVATPSDAMAEGRYHRAVIDPVRKTFVSEELLSVACEFPRVHPDIEGADHAVTWLARADLRGIVRYDTRGGTHVEHILPQGQWASEPVFVPRSAADPRASAALEGDGHVLVLCHDDASDVGFLAVYDALKIEDGPRATVWFDHYLTATFHGVWSRVH